MTRLGVPSIVLIWLVASDVGLGGDRLEAQSREALVAEGRRLFCRQGLLRLSHGGRDRYADRPDLRRAAARPGEATPARGLRDPATQAPTRHMPNLQLSEGEPSALAAYLAPLR